MSDELTLISGVLSGDSEAWKAFAEEYSPIIQKTIARYVRDEETARDLYTTLLQRLKNGKLETFDFRSKLSTWLFIVTRNHCRDYYRSVKGVRYLIKALDGLGAAERRFFQLYYIQRLPLPQVFESMRLELGSALSYVDIFEYGETIRRTLAEKKLGRLLDRLLHPDIEFVHPEAYENTPRAGRLEIVEAPSSSPEAIMQGEILQRALENLRDALLRLPHRDQLILQLRFEHKLSARRIGEILDMGSEKQVYRRLDRLFGELRKMLLDTDVTRETYGEVIEDIEFLFRLNALRNGRLGG